MIGASTRNTAAMRTRMGMIIGTCGERREWWDTIWCADLIKPSQNKIQWYWRWMAWGAPASLFWDRWDQTEWWRRRTRLWSWQQRCSNESNTKLYNIQTTQGWNAPEEVDDALKVSGDQHHQWDKRGEDERWRRSQPVDVGHGQNIWLQNEHRSA